MKLPPNQASPSVRGRNTRAGVGLRIVMDAEVIDRAGVDLPIPGDRRNQLCIARIVMRDRLPFVSEREALAKFDFGVTPPGHQVRLLLADAAPHVPDPAAPRGGGCTCAIASHSDGSNRGLAPTMLTLTLIHRLLGMFTRRRPRGQSRGKWSR